MRQHFFAPWSTKLKTTTAAFLLILVVVAIAAGGWGSLIAVAVALVAAAFAIRGYSIAAGQLLIHRLGWATKYDLADLTNAEVSPGVTMGSIRTLGIGGLFGFVGHYHNEILGNYKAYATNEFNTVSLEFAGKTIVVSPDDPLAFVEALQAARAELLNAAVEGGEA